MALAERPAQLRIITYLCRGKLWCLLVSAGGFLIGVVGNVLSYEEQLTKLALTVETVAEIWGVRACWG